MRRLLPLFACCLLPAGCSADPYPLASVSGVVTLNGEPLPGARVGFEPIAKGDGLNAGQGSYAETDAEGRFTLTALNGKEGAVVGQHRVWIRTLKAQSDENGRPTIVSGEKLPARYHDESELTFDVPVGGSAQALFALTSP
ncbi:MAG: carboxypeptidase regulatory-like domain-containing protein [Gemmataceae bacterium]